jgi:hypothetical protein
MLSAKRSSLAASGFPGKPGKPDARESRYDNSPKCTINQPAEALA